MSKEQQIRSLFAEAMGGRMDRRAILRRAAALGVSLPVAAALAQESIRGALAGEEGTLDVTYYDWILNLHPTLNTINEEFGAETPLNAQVAPTAGFGIDTFIEEARDQTSTYDMYIGVTPFVEMVQMVDAGVIEPWDAYLPEGTLESILPAIREEGSYDGKFYVWPFLLDVIVQGWNGDLVERAGLDPEKAPATWDEFIANAQKVKDSGVAPFGLTFDFHAWRSLVPITHSISTDVYDPETGIFQWNSAPAVEALEIMKRMMPLANPDVLNEGTTDAGVNGTPDEQAFASQQAAYYVKYQNAHLRFAGTWPDPARLRLGALPKTEGGAGGTVFWTTGGVLMQYGQDKEQAARYLDTLSHDQRVWEKAITGDPSQNQTATGHLTVYDTLWQEYEANRPTWLTDWAFAIKNGLGAAQAIRPTVLSVTQFNVAAPFFTAYLRGEESDAKAALDKAMDAVMAEYETATA
ncbi:MAG TPA: extracellular solute-binding protein [Thermomicrobiales bacterium]|nr:extracellular solute-binding protein [Thermomicrobiales bacterium]